MPSQPPYEASLTRFRPIFDRFAARYGLSSAHDFSDGAHLYLEWHSEAGYRCFITLAGATPPRPLQLGAHCFPPSFREIHWVEGRTPTSLPPDTDEVTCWLALEEYRVWADDLRERRHPDGSLDVQPILDALQSGTPGIRGRAAFSLAAYGKPQHVPAILAAARAERDGHARVEMIRALDKLPQPEATGVLREYLAHPGVASPWEFLVRGPAALALSRRGIPDGVHYLLEELRAANAEGRRALRWTSNQSLFEALKVPLYTGSPEVAGLAAEAFFLLPEYAIPVLTHARARVPGEVRERIEQLLAKLGLSSP